MLSECCTIWDIPSSFWWFCCCCLFICVFVCCWDLFFGFVCVCVCVCVCLCVVLGLELRVFTLSHSTSPIFCDRVFQDTVSQTICPGWLQTAILLISDCWVASIIGVSHWHLAPVVCFEIDNFTLTGLELSCLLSIWDYKCAPLHLTVSTFLTCIILTANLSWHFTK
jgi:hypothetical protein